MQMSDQEPHDRMSILVLSRNLETARGGVASFVRSQIRQFHKDAAVSHLTIGRRTGESALQMIPRLFRDVVELRRKLSADAYDVIQLNPSLNFRSLLRDYAFCRVAQKYSRGCITTVFHGWDPDIADTISRNSFLRWLFLRSFGRADLFVVLAPQFADQATDIGVPEDAVRILTTMFDEEVFAATRSLPADKQKTILFMSRLVPEKGAGELIEAFARGKSSLWPDWRLVIAGDGPDRERLNTLVGELAPDGSVSLPGYLVGGDKLRLLSEASVFALPTRYNEGIPISLIEAMSSGCALLTTRAGGLGTILRDIDNGVVLTLADTDTVFDGLKKLTSDPAFLATAKRNCHRLAWDTFGSSRVFAQLRSWMRACRKLSPEPGKQADNA